MNHYGWRKGAVLWGAMMAACAACTPPNDQVGSECAGGVCLAASLEGPKCTAINQIAELAITSDAGVPDTRWNTLCLGREYPRDAQGKVNCKVWWKLPAEPMPGTPRSCSDRSFLSPASSPLPPGTEDSPFSWLPGETVCLVDQVSPPTASSPGQSEDGWFYKEDHPRCVDPAREVGLPPTAMAYTKGASPLNVETYMRCAEVSITDAPDAGTAATTDATCELPADSAEHTGSVGDPCTLNPPDGRALESEVYVQAPASECGTGVCVGFHLAGYPNRVCDEDEPSSSDGCVNEDELEQRVYCSCRCDAPAGSADACDCPKHFGCVEALPDGPPGLRGSYCVRDGTYATEEPD
jgi:hypothetical protein